MTIDKLIKENDIQLMCICETKNRFDGLGFGNSFELIVKNHKENIAINVSFSMGESHEEVKIEDVLNGLVIDAQTLDYVDNAGDVMEQFSYKYEMAKKVFRALKENRQKLEFLIPNIKIGEIETL